MRVLITGAAGFIGQELAKTLLLDGTHEVTLTDIVEPPLPSNTAHGHQARVITADLLEASETLAAEKPDAALLFHGIMSSGAEADFEGGYRANVDATRALLFALAKSNPGLRVIYASSIAVYGEPRPKRGLTEAMPATPESSYGCQKVICETYVNDLTRRGMIDGISLRIPGITVRAGAPTAAASSFLSGIIREPMNGQVCKVPLSDRQWRTWVCSPRTLVDNIVIALGLPREALPLHRRTVLVPGFAVTLQGMRDALREIGGEDKLKLVREEDDEGVKRLVYSWPEEFDNSLGLSLGMKQDESFVQIVRDYCESLG